MTQLEIILTTLENEVARDIKAGLPCPTGAEIYREKLIAGLAKG